METLVLLLLEISKPVRLLHFKSVLVLFGPCIQESVGYWSSCISDMYMKPFEEITFQLKKGVLFSVSAQNVYKGVVEFTVSYKLTESRPIQLVSNDFFKTFKILDLCW